MRAFLALLLARNKEYLRDRSALAWSLILPIFIVIGFSFAFSNEQRDLFKVGYVDQPSQQPLPLQHLDYIQWVAFKDRETGIDRVRYHQIDLLLEAGEPTRYWINPDSRNGYFLQALLTTDEQAEQSPHLRQSVSGRAVRYLDWVMPGILGMNMMFSSLFGVGYVIVRYRKNGVLKRLQATPISAAQFVSAQVTSRLMITLTISSLIFIGSKLLIDFIMLGSYLALLLVALMGAISMISLGLLIAAHTASEELAGGLLNICSWPMMFLSGVWFSLEGAHPWMQSFAQLLPLTHIVAAARSVMIDGAGLLDVGHHLLALGVMTLLFVALASRLFRWERG
ncbi:ABC transporter permease [Aestuariirhabdus sp. Z084]|uniref:ABC transporter permease n=1 Tax=Aestuariirhabdus haliotis TaxID=2918751 RepID=UPI00201B4268|nr:ABC transporter permease [Aestuariirhabdus haliotis]MCL6415978.1 ABC transporter permease [Aestuariirhabdus haliotis]MCL6419989.1 ABC transporter permease [Aestuariirhabdus haliotis]